MDAKAGWTCPTPKLLQVAGLAFYDAIREWFSRAFAIARIEEIAKRIR